MKLKRFIGGAVVAAATLCAGAAHAALFQFTVAGDYSATWQLDTDIEPDVIIEELGITYYGVVGNYPGAVSNVADITFFSGSFGGGLTVEDWEGGTYLVVTDGPQIYGGTEASPVFTAGTWALTAYEGAGNYTLTISAVPEPATYGMLLAGVGMVGAALRRRQRG